VRRYSRNSAARLALLLLGGSAAAGVQADGLVIDKVYHPYVDALETELEVRQLFQDEQPGKNNKAQVYQMSLGKALTDEVFAEVYIHAAKDRSGGWQADAWEVEVKWQLSEQGEYWADYGLLFEYEDERQLDAREFTVGFLAEKELGSWSTAANFMVIREWGNDIQAEFETTLALQSRYRLRESFEPGVEFYAGEDTRGFGPVLQGTWRTGVRRSLHWEAGLVLGLDNKSPDRTWRFLFEYEF
jgi:hypothetical protein